MAFLELMNNGDDPPACSPNLKKNRKSFLMLIISKFLLVKSHEKSMKSLDKLNLKISKSMQLLLELS